MYNEYGSIVETFYDDDDLKIEVELNNDILFAHALVKNSKLSSMKKLKQVWEIGKRYAWLNGFDCVHTYTSNTRFVEFLGGGEKLDEVEFEGNKLGVYQWQLQQ